MRGYVIAVSVAHLYLLVFYVKSGIVGLWQFVTPVVGFDQIANWSLMMVSAATAPLVIGTVAWGADRGLRRLSFQWTTTIRELMFITLSVGGLLALVNAGIRLETSLATAVIVPVLRVAERSLVVFALFGLLVASISVFGLVRLESVRRRLTNILGTTMIILAPTTLFSVFGTAYVLTSVLLKIASVEEPRPHLDAAVKSALAAGLPENIVVLLFDGFSYNVGFKDGEADPRLPNLRALASESVVFHNLRSFPGRTSRNVPVMLTGRNYSGSRVGDPDVGDVAILADGSEVALRDVRNLFDLAHESGYLLTIQGIYVDYCGTYVRSKGKCDFVPVWRLPLSSPDPIGAVIDPYRSASISLLPWWVEKRLSSLIGVDLDEERHFQWYTLSRHNDLLDALSDPVGVFAYAHYPIPHYVKVYYDATTRELGPGETVFQSFEVVDAFLGEVRNTLKRSGAWDTTFLVIVSDHHEYRETNDPRVPLLLKLPGSERPYDYHGEWTHEQFLPMFEELFRRRSFNLETTIEIINKLAPTSD